MSFFADFPSKLQIIINNYEPQFIILCDNVDWHRVIRQNFRREFSTQVPNFELKNMYVKKCLKQKTIFSFQSYTIIISGDKFFGNGCIYTSSNFYFDQLYSCTTFKEIREIPHNISEIFCDEGYIIIILSDGKILGSQTLPYNAADGYYEINGTKFKEFQGVPQNILQMAHNFNQTMFLLTDGRILNCKNIDGIEYDDYDYKIEFEEILGIARNISKIICGDYHTFILLTDGKILSCPLGGCGNNEYGQLGHGDIINRVTFTEINGLPSGIS